MNRQPVVLVGQNQVKVFVPVQVGQIGSYGIPDLPFFPWCLEAFGSSQVQHQALLLGVVVQEEDIPVTVFVYVSRGYVGSTGGGQGRAPFFVEASRAVPIDVRLQMHIKAEALSPFDTPV